MAAGLLALDKEHIILNGMPVPEGAPQILSVSFPGVRSEVLLHTLEERGIYVSAGSACSSHKRKASATLAAMGLSREQLESTVRISFSEENTFEEVDYCLAVLGEVLPCFAGMRGARQLKIKMEEKAYVISRFFD